MGDRLIIIRVSWSVLYFLPNSKMDVKSKVRCIFLHTWSLHHFLSWAVEGIEILSIIEVARMNIATYRENNC